MAGYLLEDQIGAGGMAVVFRARDERLYRTVALKAMAPGLAGDDEFRERFIRESRAAAAVDHPHIIPVYGAGEADGILYIAMRFVSGGDLRSVLRREGPLPAERASFLLSPIASALDAAHATGLVHRDVKPANILIDSAPTRFDHPYLSDFGLSKGTASVTGLTAAGQFVGTPDYSAPEQISGKPVNVQTDQYALACVAFQALTGKAPFIRDQPMAVLLAHLNDPPPSVIAQRPDLSPAVDRVLSRALAKNPGDRFASCGEFASSLSEALRERSDSHLAAELETASITRPGAWAAPERGITMASRAPVPLTTATDPAAPDSRARTEPAGLAPSAAAGRTIHGRRHAGPARRARSLRVAVAVAVVVAGAVVAATMLINPGTSTRSGSPVAGHSSGPASRGGAAITSHRGPAAILSGTFKDPGGKGVLAVALRDDGTLAAVDSNDHGYVFATRSRSVIDTLALGSRGTSYAQLSPDGQTLSEPNSSCFTMVGTCEFMLINVATGHVVGGVPDSYGFLTLGNSAAAAVDAEKDGMNVVSATSGSTLADVIDPDHHFVVGGAISGDGKVMAASSDGGDKMHTLYIWNVAAKTLTATLKVAGGTAIGQTSLGPSAGSAALNQDGKTLAVTDGTTTYVYSVPSGHQVSAMITAMLALSPDGTLLAGVDDAGQVQVWNVTTAKVIGTLAVVPNGASPPAVAFSSDGKQVAVGSPNGSTSVWTISR